MKVARQIQKRYLVESVASVAVGYADTHPRLIIRGYAPTKDLAETARDVAAWDAEGFSVNSKIKINRFFWAPSNVRFLWSIMPSRRRIPAC